MLFVLRTTDAMTFRVIFTAKPMLQRARGRIVYRACYELNFKLIEMSRMRQEAESSTLASQVPDESDNLMLRPGRITLLEGNT